jgi:hypothetical protein
MSRSVEEGGSPITKNGTMFNRWVIEVSHDHDQAEFDIRCEWGPQGVEMLAPISDVVIIGCVLLLHQRGDRYEQGAGLSLPRG